MNVYYIWRSLGRMSDLASRFFYSLIPIIRKLLALHLCCPTYTNLPRETLHTTNFTYRSCGIYTAQTATRYSQEWPRKYSTYPMLLNFSVLMGTSVVQYRMPLAWLIIMKSFIKNWWMIFIRKKFKVILEKPYLMNMVFV